VKKPKGKKEKEKQRKTEGKPEENLAPQNLLSGQH